MSIDSEPEIIFKWTNLCRLCLSPDSLIDLFSSEVTSQDCLSKIRSCLNLLVYYGDPMPTKICSKCHLKLDEWSKFRKECIQNEANIKKRLHPYRDIKFVKAYFEKCAKFESSEIVSSSSKSNTNSIQAADEVNSSVSTLDFLDDIKIRRPNKKPLSAILSEDLRQHPGKKFRAYDGKVKFKSAASASVKQEQNIDSKKDWAGDESGLLGTIVSVTGSASAVWDTQSPDPTDESNYYYNSEHFRHVEGRGKPHHYDFLQDKTCPNCGVEFASEEEFDVHTCCMIGSSTHIEEDDGHFEDSISLGSEYDGTEYSLDHLSVGPEKPVRITPWKCIPCRLYFSSCLELRRHYCSVSCLGKKVRAIHCEFCYRQFLTFNDLLEHQVVHINIKLELTEDDLICCNQCNLQFPDERRYKNHLLVHALKRRNPIKYTCSSCSQVFFQKDLYEKHLESHVQIKSEEGELMDVTMSPILDGSSTPIPQEGSDEPKKVGGAIRCFRCGQMFASVKQLEHHETIKHKNPTPFICRKCGLRFSARSQLLMHLRVHMSKSAKSPSEACEQACSVCDAKFLLESDLESHMKTHKQQPGIDSEPPSPTAQPAPEENESNRDMFARYKCSLCSRLYVRANSCIRHGQQSHKGQKVIPLRLKRSVFLGRRTSLPLGGKIKHKCTKCPKYFYSFNAFSLHSYRIHGLKLSNPGDDPSTLETEDISKSPQADELESKCPFCSKDIKPSYISLHIKKFHRGEVLDPALIDEEVPMDSCICRYCLKTCSTPHNRKLHESIHYPVKAQRNQCETCGQKFQEAAEHEEHARTCKSIRCGKCHKIFFKFITLTQHACLGTKSDEAHKCTVCLSAFTSLDLLQIHIKNFHGKKSEVSPQPGTSRVSAKKLERELWREESNKIVCMVGEKFYCTFCDCEFSTIHESNEHRAAHPRGNWYAVQISDSLFQCTICDKFFESRKSSLLHINYHKKNLMPEPAKPLQLSFEPEVEIFTEIKSETPKSKKYNCRYCAAGFKDEEDLQDHLFHTHVNQT